MNVQNRSLRATETKGSCNHVGGLEKLLFNGGSLKIVATLSIFDNLLVQIVSGHMALFSYNWILLLYI